MIANRNLLLQGNSISPADMDYYKRIAEKVFGNSSLFYCQKVNMVVNAFKQCMIDEMLTRKSDFHFKVFNYKFKINKVQKTNKQLLNDYANKNFDLYTAKLDIEFNDNDKNHVSKVKIDKDFDKYLNEKIIVNKTLKKYYHEININA